jgi:DNA-binding beta-propeller fold protein YncE
MSRTMRRRRRGLRGSAAHLAVVTAMTAAAFAAVAPAATLPADYQSTTVQSSDLSAYPTPSPDPSGITYMPDTGRLFISDSEVDEMPIFQNANLYEVSRTGALMRTGVTTPWSHEPSGVSWDPIHRTMYVTDDDLLEVFVVETGTDQLIGTVDDTVSSFSVTPFGSTDPQGPAYDTATGDLYVVDGGGNIVYRIQPGPNGIVDGIDDVYSHFVMPAASRRPGGITYDPATNTLFVCDSQSKALYQLDAAGNHLATVHIPATAPLPGGCDVTVALASTGGRNTFWLTTRGLDNDTNPGENDGRLYELASDLLGQAGPGPGQIWGPPSVSINSPSGARRRSGPPAVGG